MQGTADKGFDANTMSRKLIVAIALSLTATAGVLSAVLSLVNDASWWRGLLAAGIASTLAAAASAMPLIWSLHRGINQRVIGFFVASGIRMTISLGACILAITAGNYPVKPTLLLMVVFYFAVLAVEATFAAKTLWNARD